MLGIDHFRSPRGPGSPLLAHEIDGAVTYAVSTPGDILSFIPGPSARTPCFRELLLSQIMSRSGTCCHDDRI